MRIHSLSVKMSVVAAAAIAAVFGAGTYYLAQDAGEVIDHQNQEIQTNIALEQALTASRTLDVAARVGENISTIGAALKSKGVVDRATLDEVLKTLLEKNTNVLGTWTGWEPDALDGKDKDFVSSTGHDATGRFMPYWNRGSGSAAREVLLDYEKPGAGDYYLKPFTLNRSVAIEPYIYPINGKNVLIASFGIPIVVDGKTVGVGGVDINLESLNESMQQIKPFGTGFVSLVSATGLAVTHPKSEAVGKALGEFDAPTAQAAKDAIASNKSVSLDGTGPDGKPWRFLATPISAGGTQDHWAVIVAVPLATLQAAVAETRHSMFALSAVCILIVAGLMFHGAEEVRRQSARGLVAIVRPHGCGRSRYQCPRNRPLGRGGTDRQGRAAPARQPAGEGAYRVGGKDCPGRVRVGPAQGREASPRGRVPTSCERHRPQRLLDCNAARGGGVLSDQDGGDDAGAFDRRGHRLRADLGQRRGRGRGVGTARHDRQRD